MKKYIIIGAIVILSLIVFHGMTLEQRACKKASNLAYQEYFSTIEAFTKNVYDNPDCVAYVDETISVYVTLRFEDYSKKTYHYEFNKNLEVIDT